MSGIIEVTNLSFGYAAANPILKNICFEVPPGTFLVIAGLTEPERARCST